MLAICPNFPIASTNLTLIWLLASMISLLKSYISPLIKIFPQILDWSVVSMKCGLLHCFSRYHLRKTKVYCSRPCSWGSVCSSFAAALVSGGMAFLSVSVDSLLSMSLNLFKSEMTFSSVPTLFLCNRSARLWEMYKVRIGVPCKQQWLNGGLKGHSSRPGWFYMLYSWAKH